MSARTPRPWGSGVGKFDEKAVFSVACGGSRDVLDDGHDALALFSRAFGDELLEPAGERPERWRDDERQLVDAPRRSGPQDRPEPGPRIFVRRFDTARVGDGPAREKQAPQVDSLEGRRQQAERREGGEPPADVRPAGKRPAEAERCGQGLERGPRVGDGDEPAAGAGVAEFAAYPVVKKGEEGDEFRGRPRLRRDDEQGSSGVEALGRRGHGSRLGRIQDLELERAVPRPESAGEDLRGEA
jgi:hypothetical protein